MMVPLAGFAQDLAASSPRNVQVEVDNASVRVLRVRAAAHEKLAMHEHRVPYVVVYLTDIHLMHYLPGGTKDEVRAKAGDARWVQPVKHSDENLSDHPFECLLIEVKPEMLPQK